LIERLNLEENGSVLGSSRRRGDPDPLYWMSTAMLQKTESAAPRGPDQK